MDVKSNVSVNKRCSRCGEEKPLEDFYRNRRKKDGKNSYCKPCSLAAKRDHWKKAEDTRARSYETHLLNRYGMTPEDYHALRESQEGCCVVCGCDPRVEFAHLHEKVQRLQVEHSHQTGNLRGLVCQRCNKHVYWAGENLELVRRILDYLEGRLTPTL